MEEVIVLVILILGVVGTVLISRFMHITSVTAHFSILVVIVGMLIGLVELIINLKER